MANNAFSKSSRAIRGQDHYDLLPPSVPHDSHVMSRHWYELTRAPDPKATHLGHGCERPPSQLLEPILGIDDPRTNARIGYLGLCAVQELKRRVDTSRAAVASAFIPPPWTSSCHLRCRQVMRQKLFEPKLLGLLCICWISLNLRAAQGFASASQSQSQSIPITIAIGLRAQHDVSPRGRT